MPPEKIQAFLALPLKDATSFNLADQIGSVLEEQAVEAIRPAALGATGELAQNIQSAIRRADLMIADLTGKNPNVLFELGVAFGLSKPVLLLSQEPVKDVPFDLRAYQVAVYRPDDLDTVRQYVKLWLRDVLAGRAAAAS